MSDKDLNKLDLANKARLLLENQLLKDWWKSAELNLFKEFKSTDFREVERLQELQCKMSSLLSMRKDFERYVREGENAQSKLGSTPTALDKVKSVI